MADVRRPIRYFRSGLSQNATVKEIVCVYGCVCVWCVCVVCVCVCVVCVCGVVCVCVCVCMCDLETSTIRRTRPAWAVAPQKKNFFYVGL